MTPSKERLERLKKQEEQLKARIQNEKAKLNKATNKQRTGKLIAWGVAVEQLLADDTFQAEWWTLQCRRVLSGRTLERALAGQLKNDIKSCEPREAKS